MAFLRKLRSVRVLLKFLPKLVLVQGERVAVCSRPVILLLTSGFVEIDMLYLCAMLFLLRNICLQCLETESFFQLDIAAQEVQTWDNLSASFPACGSNLLLGEQRKTANARKLATITTIKARVIIEPRLKPSHS